MAEKIALNAKLNADLGDVIDAGDYLVLTSLLEFIEPDGRINATPDALAEKLDLRKSRRCAPCWARSAASRFPPPTTGRLSS